MTAGRGVRAASRAILRKRAAGDTSNRKVAPGRVRKLASRRASREGGQAPRHHARQSRWHRQPPRRPAGLGRQGSVPQVPTTAPGAPRHARRSQRGGRCRKALTWDEAQGSIGRRCGGNTASAQRTCQWSKALRSRTGHPVAARVSSLVEVGQAACWSLSNGERESAVVTRHGCLQGKSFEGYCVAGIDPRARGPRPSG